MTAVTSNDQQPRSYLARFSVFMLALMCVVPFLSPHHYPPIATFYNEWIAALLGLVAAIFLLRKPPADFVFPMIAFVPIGLMLLLGIQIPLGKALYWQNHYLIMLYLGLAALMMVLGANLRERVSLEKIVPTLAWAVIAGGIISMAIIVLAKMGLAEKDPWSFFIRDYSASHIGQINHLANYLALGLASIIYLFISYRIRKSGAALLAFIFVLGLAYTGQRMAVLYIIVLSLLGWWLAGRCQQIETRAQAKHLLLLIPFYIVAELVIPLMTFLEVSSTPVDRVAANMGRESHRLIYLEQAWLLFQQYPVLGAGWGEFGWHNFNVTDQYPSQTGLTNHAHNIVFQLMAEMGILAAFLFLGGVIWWLFRQRLGEFTPERWWLLALLAVLGIHSLLEYPLWYAYFLVIASLALGLGEQSVLRKRLQLTPVLFIGVLVFAAWSMGNLLQHYHKLEQTLMAFKLKQVEETEINGILDQLNTMRQSSPLTPFVDNVIIRILPNHPQLLADKLAINQKVVHFWPGKSETYTHATLLVMNDQKQAGMEMMRMAIKQFPDYPPRYLPLVTSEMIKGRTVVVPLVFLLQEAADKQQ
ncbi:MAG: O-antigen ligase C-terminal domain-containing protein [Methylophaga sp.]|nr:O-antigen ligase C-terminal domain-containing protein [Methylophaga sp.]